MLHIYIQKQNLIKFKFLMLISLQIYRVSSSSEIKFLIAIEIVKVKALKEVFSNLQLIELILLLQLGIQPKRMRIVQAI